MTMYLFNKLTELVKAEVLWEDGTLIDERTEGTFRIALYQLYAFYVEIYYDNEDNGMKNLVSFNNTNRLKPYLEKIDLERLLQL